MSKSPLILPPKRDSSIISNIIPFNSIKQLIWFTVIVFFAFLATYIFSVFNDDKFNTTDYLLILASTAIGGSGVFYQLLPRVIEITADHLTLRKIERIIDEYCQANGYNANRSHGKIDYRVKNSIFSFQENHVTCETNDQSITIRAPLIIANILHEKIISETTNR